MVVNYETITDEKSYSNRGSPSSNGSGKSKENGRGLSGVLSSLGQNRVILNISGVANEQAHERTPEQIEQVNIDNVCVICLEEMDEESGEVFTIPICQHRFHDACVRRWKKEKATCPTCRGVMPEELGLTDEHIWIGSRQITINAHPPPEPTFCHVFLTILFTPIWVVYALVVVLVFTIIVFLVCIFFVFFLFAFMQWYAWVDGDDMSFCGKICLTVTSVLLFPFCLTVFLLLWFRHFLSCLQHLVKFYKNVCTCRCRWTNAVQEICVPTLRLVQGAFQAMMRQTDPNNSQDEAS